MSERPTATALITSATTEDPQLRPALKALITRAQRALPRFVVPQSNWQHVSPDRFMQHEAEVKLPTGNADHLSEVVTAEQVIHYEKNGDRVHNFSVHAPDRNLRATFRFTYDTNGHWSIGETLVTKRDALGQERRNVSADVQELSDLLFRIPGGIITHKPSKQLYASPL